MTERVKTLCGKDCKVRIATFHSICNQILKKHGSEIHIKKVKMHQNPKSTIKRIVEEEDLPNDTGYYLSNINAAKNKMQKVEDYIKNNQGRNTDICKVYKRYEELVNF